MSQTLSPNVPTPAAFLERARELRSQIDAALRGFSLMRDGCPASLQEAMQYSLLSPGKRLRPIVVLLSAEACGAEADRAMPAACAVEMIHAYSLIHDDLPAMDDDDLRRGRPTCHKKFGEALAILAGDALLTLAFEVLAKGIRPPEVASACCAALAEATGACQLVGGQADDVSGRLIAGGIDALESVYHRKTGALIMASTRLGALVAGADAARTRALRRYGRSLGLAFQITDDLLDVQGDEQQAGKRLHKDSDRGKLTYPGLIGIEASVIRSRRLVAGACRAIRRFGKKAKGLVSLARYVVEKNG